MIFKAIKGLRHNFNSAYSKAMYEAWKSNPDQVHQDWTLVFNKDINGKEGDLTSSPEIEKEKSLALKAYMLIRYYKTRGHQRAELDPLRIFVFMQVYQTTKSSAKSLPNLILRMSSTKTKQLMRTIWIRPLVFHKPKFFTLKYL